MHTKRSLVLILVAFATYTTQGTTAAANINDGKQFGVVVVSKEKTVAVETKDYGTVHCTGVEYHTPSKSTIIIYGKSDKGFSGGMIYEETEKNKFPTLLGSNSFWGGILAHEEQGIDDAVISVRTAVASICQSRLYYNDI